jgi:hypothetical protein
LIAAEQISIAWWFEQVEPPGVLLHHLMWMHCHADTTGSPKDERRGHVG